MGIEHKFTNWLQYWIAQHEEYFSCYGRLRLDTLLESVSSDDLVLIFARACKCHVDDRRLPRIGYPPPRIYLSGAYTLLWYRGYTQSEIGVIFDRTTHNVQVCVRSHGFYEPIKAMKSKKQKEGELDDSYFYFRPTN